MKNNSISLKLLFIMVFFIIVVGLLDRYGHLIFVSIIQSPATTPRLVKSLQNFDLVWSADVDGSQGVIDSGKYNDRQVFIDFVDNQLIMPVTRLEKLIIPTSYLTSFDLETGEINSQISLKNFVGAIWK